MVKMDSFFGTVDPQRGMVLIPAQPVGRGTSWISANAMLVSPLAHGDVRRVGAQGQGDENHGVRYRRTIPGKRAYGASCRGYLGVAAPARIRLKQGRCAVAVALEELLLTGTFSTGGVAKSRQVSRRSLRTAYRRSGMV